MITKMKIKARNLGRGLALGLASAILLSPLAGADEVALQARERPRPAFQLGLLSGPSLDWTGGNLGMSIGAHLEYKPVPMLGLGAFALYTGYMPQDLLIATGSSNATLAGVEAKLYPFANVGLYVAGRLGANVLSARITSAWDNSQVASASETDLMLGGALGYNGRISKSFSIGPELAYFQTQTSAGPERTVNLLLKLDYWL